MRRTFVLVLAAAAAAAAVMPTILTAQLPLPQQGPPVDPDLRFEVASVKTFDASSGGMRMMLTPGRLDATGVPVRLLLRQALRMQDYQIIGAPGWIDSERYTVVAKAPEGTPQNALPVMLINLLKDRFNLAMRTETRELPIFNLVLARSDARLGPNLKESPADCQAMIAARRGGAGRPGGPPGPGGPGGPPAFDPNAPAPCGSMRMGPGIVGGGGHPIAQLVQMLSQFTGRPVIDKTGLTGIYDFSLKWAPDPGSTVGPFGPPPPGATLPAVDPDAPNIYTAVQEQLGLKLDNARGPVDVVVIERIDKPTPD